jgi:hypothetical protein
MLLGSSALLANRQAVEIYQYAFRSAPVQASTIIQRIVLADFILLNSCCCSGNNFLPLAQPFNSIH